MQRARQQADLVYVETVMVVNAFAVVEQQQGVSPYDHAIDVVNQDQEYYVQQVFPRGVKKLKITANVYFSYYQGETWREAVDEGLASNEGWTVTADDEVLYQQRRLLDKQGEPVDAATKVEAGQYSLEAEAQDGGDVTPVTPE